ncbi:MAG TPA: hypothetical protein VIU42_15170 [Xanthobacteraceae bacterium]
MDQPLPIQFDRIKDPETGLALLSKRSGEETPEQGRTRLFWQFQFMQWRDWRAGDVLAVARAIGCCSHLNRPPPRWLCKASVELCERSMSDDEKRAYGDLTKHLLRWQAAEQVRGRRPFDSHIYKKKVRGDAVWTEAAKMLAGTEIKRSPETMRQSHRLIRRAGGEQVTLPSYRRAVEERDRRRKKNQGRLLRDQPTRGRLLLEQLTS